MRIFLCFISSHQIANIAKKKENENDLNAMALYEKAMDDYNHKMNDYYDQVDKEKEQYLKKLDEYNKEILPEYETKVDDIMKKHDFIYSKLKNALDVLYSENIIYPKYRNLIAISAINEYLMSGRCYELEGPNGAYNLYEMELRQNLIIDKLSDIVSDLGKIKSNQFSLYESLQQSNKIITSIMNEMKNLNKTSNLISYYARATALAEYVPKFIIGYTKSLN